MRQSKKKHHEKYQLNKNPPKMECQREREQGDREEEEKEEEEI